MTSGGFDYVEVRLACHPDASEAVTNHLWETGALGVVEAEELRAFFPPRESPEAIRERLSTYLRSLETLGLPGALGPVELGRLTDSSWGEGWRIHFRPLRVGRFWITPPWDRPPLGDGECLIRINPGRAFGTGQHETTRICLRLLDDFLKGARPTRALDIGTGSGILAIAAVGLGIPECLAVDVDPDAVAAARENVHLNQVDHKVRVALASAESLEEPPFALILANLLTETHQALLPLYSRVLAPGGQAVLGGILAVEEDQLAAALRAGGLRVVERIGGAEWCALRVERRCGPIPCPP